MPDCWAITQRKSNRCGRCTGDCNFNVRPVTKLHPLIRGRSKRLQQRLNLPELYRTSDVSRLRVPSAPVDLLDWRDDD